ncbi:hypothetical protein ILYODFUR_032905 [Ilyodon furcidens]|uniref:Uncharacterized protein n=1 Tax=Ilyodon furcidens TaxID=33524 RepID=A0ABV0V8T6_9TELE
MGDKRVQPRVPSLCFHQGMRDRRIAEIFEVLLPPPDNVPTRGQQLPTPPVNSVGEAVLPPPEAPDGLPELLRGQSFFMASSNSSQAPGSASATAWAKARLASQPPQESHKPTTADGTPA